MTLKNFKPKYSKLEIYINKEHFGLMEIPQIMEYDFALTMYGDRKVILSEVHEDKKTTEIIIENEEQFRKRKKFEN